MSGIDEILAGYENLRPGQEAFYQDLHQHPELSHQEHRTARRVAEQLRGDGFTVQSGIGGTGVAGVLANGSGPTVLLRCELDALPLRETPARRTRAPSPSRTPHGHEVPVDHACGHDMHMACHDRPWPSSWPTTASQWNGTLIPLFQPAEETGDGAQEMVDDGLFKRIPVPDVALAQHLLPGIAGTVRTRARAVHVGRRQHQGHRVRAGRPRLHAAERRRPGGTRGHDRRPAADRGVPRGRARRHRGGDRRAACRPAPGATSSPTTPSWSSTCAATPP